MAVLLLRNRKRTDELCRREGLDGRAHKSGALTRDNKVHAGTLGHRTDTAVLKVRLIGIGGGKTSLLVVFLAPSHFSYSHQPAERNVDGLVEVVGDVHQLRIERADHTGVHHRAVKPVE